MEKLIDDIIELILGDIDCHHEQDHNEDGVHTSVEYNLNNKTKLRGAIRELIEQHKPGVTKEWMSKDLTPVIYKVACQYYHCSDSDDKQYPECREKDNCLACPALRLVGIYEEIKEV